MHISRSGNIKISFGDIVEFIITIALVFGAVAVAIYGLIRTCSDVLDIIEEIL